MLTVPADSYRYVCCQAILFGLVLPQMFSQISFLQVRCRSPAAPSIEQLLR